VGYHAHTRGSEESIACVVVVRRVRRVKRG
jgi:hypothetical protein